MTFEHPLKKEKVNLKMRELGFRSPNLRLEGLTRISDVKTPLVCDIGAEESKTLLH
jgi:hypothetical protein